MQTLADLRCNESLNLENIVIYIRMILSYRKTIFVFKYDILLVRKADNIVRKY